MKLTTTELRRIISEEVSNALSENDNAEMTDSTTVEEPEDLVNKFNALLGTLESRLAPIAVKIDTVNELAGILDSMIKLAITKSNGGLSKQEVIQALTDLRTNQLKTQTPAS